ncbi:hypothetical protein SNE40_002685 [Patella caerulea]|uniref:CST complex subunit STN1 n=1 Tax=Patella caerulea TaxID=87958 RepID=A0AAN8KCP9_PATCE
MAEADISNDEEMKDVEDCNYQPPKYWGLDYHFRSCLKLYICEILQAPYNTPCKGVFAYKNHPFQKVDIMGVIVGIDERTRCYTYNVDDGTGVITCAIWNNLPVDNYPLRRLPGILIKKLDDVCKPKLYELGDMIHVCGKLKMFRNMREIVSSYHNKILDPSTELHRIKELPHLHQQFYNKSFTLPKTIQDEDKT